MTSEFTNKTFRKDLLYPDLSYRLVGLFFNIHNKLGRFRSEKEYCDAFEKLLNECAIIYEREKVIGHNDADAPIRNRVDFIVDNKIIIDFKTKKFVTKDDYIQMRRYLDASFRQLGLIVNFRNTYLKAKRIINPKSLPDSPSRHSNHSDVIRRFGSLCSKK